jgi:predicted RNase H-like HicB family nuclease
MRFIVMIRRTATGYSADLPDVPGCVATGLTVEHVRQQLAEALAGHLEVMRQYGESVPTPSPELAFAVDDDMGEEFCTWVEVNVNESVARRGKAGVATLARKRIKQP